MQLARQHLRQIFLHAIGAVNGADCVAQDLNGYPFEGEVAVIAIGKAASAMLEGADRVLGERRVTGLLITRAGHAGVVSSLRAVRCVIGAHPLPDRASLDAGRQLLDFIATQPLTRKLLFLISGGTSSLVEVLQEGMTLADLQRANRWLLGSGLDIHAVNAVRRTLSRIKGGRLLQYLQGRDSRVLLLSDVPGDDPASIGSGLLYPPDGPQRLPAVLPDWLQALCRDTPAAPPAQSVAHRIVASLSMALDAAADSARALGYAVHAVDATMRGDVADNARRIVASLQAAPPGVCLWGGETTVRLPERVGRGGRNQQLALCAALAMSGSTDVLLLAAGTDGSDGNTDAAGAVVDGASVRRAADAGVSAADCVRHADAGRCLAASHDLLTTGPTGTNVMDMVIGMKRVAGAPNA